MNNIEEKILNIEKECALLIDLGFYDHIPEIKNNKKHHSDFLRSIENDKDIFESKIFEPQRKIKEMEIQKLAGKNEANNAPPCPRCGGDRYNIDKQTRSGDEARSFYIKCGTCGLTQTE